MEKRQIIVQSLDRRSNPSRHNLLEPHVFTFLQYMYVYRLGWLSENQCLMGTDMRASDQAGA